MRSSIGWPVSGSTSVTTGTTETAGPRSRSGGDRVHDHRFDRVQPARRASGDEIDFWLLTDSPFDRSRFARRYPEHVFGFEIRVSSPEDTILAKLSWAKLMGGSEKHVGDALRVYEVQGTKLDGAYLERWARELSVSELWQRIQTEAESL
jgi:hypothetical protein